MAWIKNALLYRVVRFHLAAEILYAKVCENNNQKQIRKAYMDFQHIYCMYYVSYLLNYVYEHYVLVRSITV